MWHSINGDPISAAWRLQRPNGPAAAGAGGRERQAQEAASRGPSGYARFQERPRGKGLAQQVSAIAFGLKF